MFKEVASLVFDIGIYLISLTTEDKKQIISQFDANIASEIDNVKKCRLQLNKYKLMQMIDFKSTI